MIGEQSAMQDESAQMELRNPERALPQSLRLNIQAIESAALL